MKLTIQSSAAVVSGGVCFMKEEVKRLGAAAMCAGETVEGDGRIAAGRRRVGRHSFASK